MILENDGAPVHCTCPVCSEKLKPEEGYFGDMSDYAVEAAIEVANAVKAEYPDRMISIGAYNNTTRPPLKNYKLPSNVSVQIAKHSLYANWTDDARKNMYDDIIGGWLKLKPGAVTFWEYYNFDIWGGPTRMQGIPAVATEIIGQDIRRLKEMTDKSKTPFLGEFIFGFGGGRVPANCRYWWICPDQYVHARLLWNPDASVKDIRADFFKNYFGPAAEPMEKFYTLAEDTWTRGGANMGVNYFGHRGVTLGDLVSKKDYWLKQNPWDQLFTPKIMDEMAAYLSEAERVCDNTPYKERLKVVQDGFKYAMESSVKYRSTKASTEDITEALTKY
jgi:hypothetical protein